MIKLFGEEIKPGMKFFKDLPVSDAKGNSTVLPYYVISGEKDGPVLCVTSGVHGTEYPGVAANLKLYQDIDPKDLAGTVIGCTMCNYEAFAHKTSFVNPLDKKNLNDVFPGNPDGSITEVIATVLLHQLVSCADYHIDMHSGDSIEYLHPYVFYHRNSDRRTEIDEKAHAMARAYALDYIAVTESDGPGASDIGNFYASVSELGIPCIQPEIGGIGLVDEKTRSLHYQGVRNVLDLLGMLRSDAVTTNSGQVELDRFYRLRSGCNGVYNRFVDPGDRFVKGQKLANITDYHGVKELEAFYAEADGVVLWTMAGLATRKNDTLLALGVINGRS